MKYAVNKALAVLLIFSGLLSCRSGFNHNCYSIHIVQQEKNSFVVDVTITLKQEEFSKDTLTFCFGGLIPDLTLSNLRVASYDSIPYVFNTRKRVVHIATRDITKNQIQFKYTFNPIWGITQDSASIILENRMSYFIPALSHDNWVSIEGDIREQENFRAISNLQIVNGTITKEIVSLQNTAFVFMEWGRYKHSTHTTEDGLSILIHTTDPKNNDVQHQRLSEKVINCINYLSKEIAPFKRNTINIVEIQWHGSSYFNGLCLVDSRVFKTYTIFHEITHEWIGGEIPIIEGSKGEFLVKESLNEYIMLQTLKLNEGDSIYDYAVNQYKNRYMNFLKTKNDSSIMSIEKYVLSVHPLIIDKQIYLLDSIAQQLGPKKFNKSLLHFLKTRYNRPTETKDFVNFLKQEYGDKINGYIARI